MQSVLIQNINSSELEEIISKAVANAIKKFSIEIPMASHEPVCDKLLTKQEAAKYLKISLPTLNKYIKGGYLKAYTVSGTRMRFRQTDLDRSLKGLRSNNGTLLK